MNEGRTTGQTKDAGFQIGAQRTVERPVDETWEFLTSPRGVRLWLGDGARLGRETGATYETSDGTRGEVRSFREHDRIRLTWRPRSWDHDSTVQVALTSADGKTAIRFHQERLADAGERERMRTHWKGVLDALERELA